MATIATPGFPSPTARFDGRAGEDRSNVRLEALGRPDERPVLPHAVEGGGVGSNFREYAKGIIASGRSVVRFGMRKLTDGDARAAMLAAKLEPLEPYTGGHSPWRCRCLVCGSECSPTLSRVKSRGSGCMGCGRAAAGRARRLDEDATVSLMRNAGMEPLAPYPGAHRPWQCRCLTCGREVTPIYSNVRLGNRCAYCAKRRVDSTEAGEAMRAAGLEPLEDYPGADAPWRCRCMRCGRDVIQTRTNVLAAGGCGYCLGRRLDEREVLATMHVARLDPIEPYPGADLPWRCRCMNCGREVSPRWSTVKDNGRCAYCSQNRVDPAHAVATMRLAGLETMEDFPGAHVGWRCKCEVCGRTSRPTYSKVRAGAGCRFCATRGLDFTAEGVVYLVVQRELFAVKVGVTTANAREDRLAAHGRDGWEELGRWNVASGDIAVEIERAVLSYWRNSLGAPQALTRDQMPRGGWSETASLLWVDVGETAARIQTDVDRANRRP